MSHVIIADFSAMRQRRDRTAELVDLDGLATFLRREHPTATALTVQCETGIPARTVECWFEGRSRPSLRHLMRLLVAYGPDALAAVMIDPPQWLVEAQQHRRARALQTQIETLKAQLKNVRGAQQ